MPEDYGLLTGLAEGLKSGVGAYYDQQKRNEDLARLKADRERQKRKEERELKEKGLIRLPNGDLEYDKESPAYQKGLLDADYRKAQLENLNANTSFLKGGKITDLDLSKGGVMRDPATGRLVNDPSTPAGQKRIEEARLHNLQEQKIMQDIALGKANEGLIKAKDEGQRKKNKGIGAPGANLKGATDLRKEYNQRQIVKDFNTIKTAYNTIKSAAASGTAAGDMSSIFAYMKILDPNSTVREGEYASAKNATGIPQRIQNWYNSAKDGQLLSPEQRKQFLSEAKNIYEARSQGLKQVQDEFSGLAGKYNVDKGLIFSPEAVEEPQGGLVKAPGAHPQDSAAVAWAKANPKDPRAVKILKANGL